MSKFSENVVFQEVVLAIESIERFTTGIKDVEEFVDNEMCFTAVLHKIQIICYSTFRKFQTFGKLFYAHFVWNLQVGF